MNSASSLDILPPRPRPRAEARPAEPAKPDSSFDEKLKKATKHKAEHAVAVKPAVAVKQTTKAAAPAAKPATVGVKPNPDGKKPKAEPVKIAEAPAEQPGDPAAEPAKVEAGEAEDAAVKIQAPPDKVKKPAAKAATGKPAAVAGTPPAVRAVPVTPANAKEEAATVAPSVDKPPVQPVKADGEKAGEGGEATAEPTTTAGAAAAAPATDDAAGPAIGLKLKAKATGRPAAEKTGGSTTAAGALASADALASVTEDAGDTAPSDAVSSVGGAVAQPRPTVVDPSAVPVDVKSPATVTAGVKPAEKPPTVQQFVEDNHPKIVTGVQGLLLPGGGSMQIRLDPPELGAIQVTVHMKNGVMEAAFETDNDDATRLLSHSLGELKTSLEAGGVQVEKMHVHQSPAKEHGDEPQSGKSPRQQEQQQQAKRDQQRQELLKRMWAKLSGGDPLDLVA